MVDPSKFFLNFLRWFCREEYLEELEGNIIEIFERDHEKFGKRAQWIFAYNVLLHFRPGYIKQYRNNLNPNLLYDMISNFIKIALRVTWKQRSYSLINFFGLTIGIAAFMIIMLHVYDEWSYDRFHTDVEKVIRVEHLEVNQEYERHISVSPGELGPLVLAQVPEVDQVTKVLTNGWGKSLLTNESHTYYGSNFLFTDSSFLKLFSFELLEGSSDALSDPSSIVLTEDVARQFFGTEDPLGKTLEFNKRVPLKVSGVLKNNHRSHLSFDFLLPISVANRPKWENWGQSHFLTYLKVHDEQSIDSIEIKIQNLVNTLS